VKKAFSKHFNDEKQNKHILQELKWKIARTKKKKNNKLQQPKMYSSLLFMLHEKEKKWEYKNENDERPKMGSTLAPMTKREKYSEISRKKMWNVWVNEEKSVLKSQSNEK